MNLTGCNAGDIVLVNDGGKPYHAEVVDRYVVKGHRPRLRVRPLYGAHIPPPVRASDVVALWRKAGRRRRNSNQGESAQHERHDQNER